MRPCWQRLALHGMGESGKVTTRIICILLLAGAPFFFVAGPGYRSARWYKELWNLGHVLYFCLIAVLLFRLGHQRYPQRTIFWLFLEIFSVILCIGVGIELLQMLVHDRHPDMDDVFRDIIGVLLAFAFLCRQCVISRIWLRRVVQGGVLLLFGLTLWPLTRSLIDEEFARKQFPLLSDFETPFEVWRWADFDRLSRDGCLARHGKYSLRVHLTTQPYSGVSLFYCPPDWHRYRWLHLSVYNPETQTLLMHFRLNDRHHSEHGRRFADRYHTLFMLHPGWNDVQVALAAVQRAPVGRPMDMKQIESFALYVDHRETPLDIHLDYVYLSR